MKVEVDVLDSMSLTDSPYGLYERQLRTQELCERRGGRPGPHVPNGLYGLRGLKETLNSGAV